jgi:hypothetical protein
LPKRKRSIVGRVLDAFIASRQRRADREIAEILRLRGGVVGDDARVEPNGDRVHPSTIR